MPATPGESSQKTENRTTCCGTEESEGEDDREPMRVMRHKFSFIYFAL